MPTPFAQTLADYVSAGYPAIAVDTHEEDRLLSDVRTFARDRQWQYAVYSVTRGWIGPDDRPISEWPGRGDPVAAVAAVRDGLIPRRTLSVLLDLHPYFQSLPELVRAVRDALDTAKGTNRPMLFCAPGWRLPQELQKDVALLDYPLPSREQLRHLLDELVQANRTRIEEARREGKSLPLPPPLTDAQTAAILDAARGLTWNEAENAFALALIRDSQQPDRLAATVQHEKTAAVRKSGLLQLLDPTDTLDGVGGLGRLKRWLAEQGHLLARAGEALSWGFLPSDLPRGMLLVGIPGTGKSLLARAVAGQWGLPLLRMDLSGLLGSLVGQSESQVRQAIQLASAMAPCVLHIDEIEKALAGADGAHDSGVMAHIVGLLLTWLQERTLGRDTAQAPVFVVATANRIDRLPPELYRPGRFDRTWFLDLGGPAERAQVLRIHLAKRRQRLPDDALEELSADPHTADFSPAELELAVQTACRRAFLEQRPVDPADLLAAIGGITPYARSHEALLGELRSFAKRWAESAQDPQTPPERLRTRTLTS